MMVFAQNRRAVNVVVDDESQLAASLDDHCDDVDPFVSEQGAHACQSARTVRQAHIQLGANRHRPNSVSKTTVVGVGAPSPAGKIVGSSMCGVTGPAAGSRKGTARAAVPSDLLRNREES